MKNFLFLLFFFSSCVSSTPAPELLFKINRSVVKVNVSNKEGNHGVGSGVVVKKDHIVTNCHVIADAQGINVNKYGNNYTPHAIIADWKNDICILKFKYLGLDPIKLSSNDLLEYETKVFGKAMVAIQLRHILHLVA